MIVNNSLDEVKKRENALSVIKDIVENKGRDHLFDLTGLAGGFIASKDELSLLETYIGPAVFEEDLQKAGIEHMGGEKIFPLNRTSSGILATILTLVEEDSYVVHYLPKLPAHPSIPRSCNLVNANYLEFDDFEEFYIPENTSLVVVTGSTMDLQVIDEDKFKKVIDEAHSQDIPVLVDDASGARLRTVIFNQKKACDLGADIAITSTDKLLVNKIKAKANQFGLEAQPPSVLAMLNGLKAFNGDALIDSFSRKDELYDLLSKDYDIFEKTPNGVMLSPEKLASYFDTDLCGSDLSFILSMILLKEEGIITIPAVSMPGASATIRFDLSTQDAVKLELNQLINKISSSFDMLKEVIKNKEKCKEIVFN